MSPIDLILFDCDGVLLDSELISSRCAADELREVGMQVSPTEVLHRFLGVSRTKIAAAAADAGHAVPSDFVTRLENRIHRMFSTELRPIDGVGDVLSQIRCPLCVASSSSLPYIRHGLRLTGLLGYFNDHLFSASMVSRPKPAPDLFLYAAEQMGVRPERCLVIEDSMAGIQAAKAANMRVFGFLGGSHLDAAEALPRYQAAGCDRVFASMREAVDLIAGVDPGAVTTQLLDQHFSETA